MFLVHSQSSFSSRPGCAFTTTTTDDVDIMKCALSTSINPQNSVSIGDRGGCILDWYPRTAEAPLPTIIRESIPTASLPINYFHDTKRLYSRRLTGQSDNTSSQAGFQISKPPPPLLATAPAFYQGNWYTIT